MPPVLRILWESGRAVVSWGLVLRVIVAILPFAVAKVAQYIINGIAGVLRGTPLPLNFWALVATEVALNVFLGLITRAFVWSERIALAGPLVTARPCASTHLSKSANAEKASHRR